MPYDISGHFIEACDCHVVCPCWVDDDPDEGHCTGLIAWVLGPGSELEGVDVSGRTVVSVSTHTGSRRGGGTATVLYVDDGASAAQRVELEAAFAGEAGGPLAALAAVSGAVVARRAAAVAVAVAPGTDRWTVTVTDAGAPLVRAEGVPSVLDGQAEPLALRHTALSDELGVLPGDQVVAQKGETMALHVGALPGGYLDVTGRSGMRGTFRYVHP
jgi:hypothetical protein